MTTESSVVCKDLATRRPLTAYTPSKISSASSPSRNDPTRRLLSVKLNGSGRYESEVNTKLSVDDNSV